MPTSNPFNRRNFLKGAGALGLSTLFPSFSLQANIDYNAIRFDESLYADNNAQTILVYLYGGPSELAGNLTNLTQIDRLSQNHYPLDRMTQTANHCWKEAGGDIMENLLGSNDLNLFRTCYRTVDDLKSHGECTTQAQHGNPSDNHAGIVANLAAILAHKGAISPASGAGDIGKSIPFVTMEGESAFFYENDLALASYLKPVAFGTGSRNPYKREGWYQRQIINPETNTTLGQMLDTMAHRFAKPGKVEEAFTKRALLETFADAINAQTLPDGVIYPENNVFAERLEQAMKLLIMNPHTKMVSMGSPGLGGWDDHSQALRNYPRRMTDLMQAISSAIDHMKAAGKNNINIVVFGEFGRNVNLNNSEGWDHGNNQNVYWFGGSDYMNHLGIVGETEVFGTGNANRLYTRPKSNSPHFQVFSIAATLYRMYGITNPEVLTGTGNGVISGLLKT